MTVLRQIVTQFVFKGNLSKIEKAERSFNGLVNGIRKADKEVKKLDNSFKGFIKSFSRIDRQIQAFMALRFISGLKNAIGGIFSASGMMEQTMVSFETMLGSAEVASALMKEIQELALKTPFGFKEATQGVKRLLAFGEGADTVIDSLKILGDIQAGTGAQLSRIVLAFGQVRTAGKLRGQEVRQFTEAGVPILEELSKELKVSKTVIQDMIRNGEVSFDSVRNSLESMTKEGGRFHNLMEKQSKTLLGRWEKLSDEAFLLKSQVGRTFNFMAKIFISTLSTLITWTRKALPFFGAFAAALTALGVVFAILKAKAIGAAIASFIAWLPVTFPFILLGLIIAGLITLFFLLADDIITFAKGGDAAFAFIYEAVIRFTKNALEFIKNFIFEAKVLFTALGMSIWESLSWPFRNLKKLIDGTLGKVKGFIGKTKDFFGGDSDGSSDVSADRNGASVIPSVSPDRGNPITNNNSASVGSPNITIVVPEGQNSQSMEATIADGVTNGLQNSLNQSLRTMAG